MKSIRVFLMIVILATMTLIVFISSLNGYLDSMTKAEQLFDSQLVDKAHLLSITFSASQIQHARELISEPDRPIEMYEFAFQIWGENKLLLHSYNTPVTPVARFDTGFSDVNFLNNRWRIYSYYHKASNIWIFAAERADLRYIIAENIILESILPVVIMLPVLGFFIWIIISFGLSPLRKLARELGNKQADDLGPLTIDKQPVELTQLITSINALFHRLKASFQREKHFASDAAHELRTPISAIKIHLHNLSDLEPDNLQENRQSLHELKLSVDRMEHLVKQILNLNRISPEQYTAHFNTIDLNSLAQEVIAREYPRFEKKQLQLTLDGVPSLIEGDLFALDVLLQNLLSNACKYTPDKGSVRVTVLNRNSWVVLKVEDSGYGVPEHQYKRLFDRFYRLDGDCHASGTTGCGLGLAIVHQIVDLHKATIRLGCSELLNGLLVTIEFPVNKYQENIC